MFHIDRIRNSQTFTMTGCLKASEKVERLPESKYFSPEDLVPDNHLPAYFSGAGYFMAKTAISEILRVRKRVPILHLDDVYIGKLIAIAGISEQMLQSVSICTGVHAFGEEYKDANNGWNLFDAPKTRDNMDL